MVTEQASEHNLSNLSGGQSAVSAERLLNLLELSNSDLTASTGMEELPISEMLLDTLLCLLQSERPELLSHSQRVAFLCYGMGRQFGWSGKRTNTLVTAALMHELGRLANSEQSSFWDEPATEEDLSRYVTIDLLECCHADSDLLEILSLSLQFRYRDYQPGESESPTPDHVLLGAAAFQFAHLFEKVRHQAGGAHHLSEIVAALQSVAEIPIEEQVVSALEEWLAGRDKIIHSFDPSMFFPKQQEMDAETAEFVRATFIEILEELYNLQKNYDAFFILDSTGRFQLWNSGCQLHHAYTIREMRNKHWHKSLIGYCNREGLAFSDAQTPLFQTLESGKPAQTMLFLKQGEQSFIEAEVISIPIMGRDRLMLGIVELHRLLGARDQSPTEILYTPEWISELAGELGRLDHEDPAAESIPDLDDELISILESRLGIAPQIPAESASATAHELSDEGDSSSNIDLDGKEVDTDETAEILLDPADSDILTEDKVTRANEPAQVELDLTESETAFGPVETETVSADGPEHTGPLDTDTKLASPDEDEEMPSEETPHAFLLDDDSDEDLPELGSHLDNLLSRFDNIVSENDEPDGAEDQEAATADEEVAPVPSDASDETPVPESEAIEFEEAGLASQQAEHEAAAGPDELEQLEEEEPAPAVAYDDVSDHVLESTIGLGEDTELPQDVEPDIESVLDEDDVLAFLTEDSASDVLATPEQAAESVEEDVAQSVWNDEQAMADDEEGPAEPSPSAGQDEQPAAVEDMHEVSVLDAEHDADFDLDPDVDVTDSELLRALEEEGSAVIEGDEFSAAAEESIEEIQEEPVAEQAEEIAEEPLDEQAEEIAEEAEAEEAEPLVEEQAEEAAEEPVAEQAEEVTEEPVAEEEAEEPAAEQAEEIAEEPLAEQAEEIAEEVEAEEAEPPLEEQAVEAAEEPVAAKVQETVIEPVTDRVQDVDEERKPKPVPVAASAEDESQESVEEDVQAAPVSRSEWDAFVSYLLDPDSEDHESVSVLFLDLDRFKAINEGFGRQIGDDLLKEISRRLSESCGKREMSCRYGGGQFAISCPGLTLEKASKRADQVRKLIERTRFDVLPFQALTVSIGVAGSEPGDTLDELMNRAEHCLYNAKLSGRNCVVALSSQQIEEELAREDEEIATTSDQPFEVVSEFEAMIASDMIVYKLGGFLYDMHAKLLHVDKRHVSMRVGSKGFLPYWGRQDDARPVLIDLELGEGWGDQRAGHKPSKKSVIHIRIRPDGWVRSQETFLKRAQHVLRELKGYFAGT